VARATVMLPYAIITHRVTDEIVFFQAVKRCLFNRKILSFPFWKFRRIS